MTTSVYLVSTDTILNGAFSSRNLTDSEKRHSYLSNKREVMLTDFIAVMYVLVFTKKKHPPRLFQPPSLLILQLLHPLHVYFNLLGY